MNNLLLVKSAPRFGNIDVVPVNYMATRVAALHGTKTLTHTALTIAESMGFIIWDITSSTLLNKITIKTKEKHFSYANTTIKFALEDICRYYDYNDIIAIELT